MSTFWEWFDKTAADAAQTAVGKLAIAAGFKVQHTGGNCLAWEKQTTQGRYFWISTEDAGLGNDPNEPYWVGLYTTDGDVIAETEGSSLIDVLDWVARIEAENA
jgi:hypothetical protein